MVERAGLENRCTLRGTEGSNPSSSALFFFRSSVFVSQFVIRLLNPSASALTGRRSVRPDRTD